MPDEATCAQVVARFRETYAGSGFTPEQHLAECEGLRVMKGDAGPGLERVSVILACGHRTVGFSIGWDDEDEAG
jgi:hypothetical protein